jgi:dynein heavy chain
MDLLMGAVRSRQEWLTSQKGQIISLVSQVLWCSNTE